VGYLYQTFSGVIKQLIRRDTLTHNVDPVWLVEDCNSMKLYIIIQIFLMYSGVKIILYSLKLQTNIQLQLPEIQRLTVHDIRFVKQHHNSVT